MHSNWFYFIRVHCSFFSRVLIDHTPRTLRWTFWDTIYNTRFIQMFFLRGTTLTLKIIFYLLFIIFCTNRIRRKIFSGQQVSIEIKMPSYIHLKFFINKHRFWRFERYFTISPIIVIGDKKHICIMIVRERLIFVNLKDFRHNST